MTAAQTVLSISDLAVSYGPTPVVHGVDLEVRRGRKVGIVGESGSGKSTVARAVLGLLPPGGRVDRGRIDLLGRDLTGLREKELDDVRGRDIALVFQDPMTSLDPVASVGSQLAETVRRHNPELGAKQVRRRCVELLDEVGVDAPEQRIDHFPHEFSGGMRQRVLIAIAIANEPAVVVADEPTTALDVTTQAQVLALLDRLVETHGIAVVLITHDMGVVAEFCDEIAVMQAGEIVERGEAADVFLRPQHPYSRRLLDAIPRPGQRRAGPEIAYAGDEAPAPVLRVEGLTQSYGGGWRAPRKVILDGLDFTVHAGETLGIVGESGAGKSTLARTVMRIQRPDAGRIELLGTDIAHSRGGALRRMRTHLQMVFQDPFSSLDPTMTVEQLVAQPLRVLRGQDRRAARPRVVAILAAMGLGEEYLARSPGSLSGGQRQRVAIARALVVRPEVVVLDEPISALDVSVRAQVLDLLRAEQRELGTAYMFVVHDLSVAEYFCDRIAVLYGGSIVELGTAAEVMRNPAHPYTRTLLGAVPDPWRHRA